MLFTGRFLYASDFKKGDAMSDTLTILKNKSRLLRKKLRDYNINIPKKHELNAFAFVLNKKCWDNIVSECTDNLKVYTDYQISFDKLKALVLTFDGYISDIIIQDIIDDIQWTSEYVHFMNTPPRTEQEYTAVPYAISQSHLFGFSKRENVKRKPIFILSDGDDLIEDRMYYSGETLTFYDNKVLFYLLYRHPNDVAFGRKFSFDQRHETKESGMRFSHKAFEASLKRMSQCNLEILDYQFKGPILYKHKRLKSERYEVMFNAKWIRLYRNPFLNQIFDLMK